MKETLIFTGGIYTVGLIVFHVLFWKIFRWPETLRTLNFVNRATMQVLNISITFIFVIFAYLSFVYTRDLVNTGLGKTLIALISVLWTFRACQQVIFYKLKHSASIGLAIYFLVGATLYGIPAFI